MAKKFLSVVYPGVEWKDTYEGSILGVLSALKYPSCITPYVAPLVSEIDAEREEIQNSLPEGNNAFASILNLKGPLNVEPYVKNLVQSGLVSAQDAEKASAYLKTRAAELDESLSILKEIEKRVESDDTAVSPETITGAVTTLQKTLKGVRTNIEMSFDGNMEECYFSLILGLAVRDRIYKGGHIDNLAAKLIHDGKGRRLWQLVSIATNKKLIIIDKNNEISSFKLGQQVSRWTLIKEDKDGLIPLKMKPKPGSPGIQLPLRLIVEKSFYD
eukprot:Protomagalhaensia_wolfi_Nauph_80__2491@NODE_2657_length_1025_cov_6_641988_g2081_i0_p1_GENE_NODE_2657_length_1025_cov_6_641988_g2081_i0NODE_2657_length_1025_cov_6_641988_g2081_i0_p1_ORF_typecomplete_len294_score63_31DUF4393/PF14337_6/0_04_NODE_2657_length_1025_cov_6_641988_g2081_i067882